MAHFASQGGKQAPPRESIIDYFNPRAREERDHGRMSPIQHHVVVSIHALAKSATVFSVLVLLRDRASIHALAKSATDGGALDALAPLVSIHALAKSATVVPVLDQVGFLRVSIHALAKSATAPVPSGAPQTA